MLAIPALFATLAVAAMVDAKPAPTPVAMAARGEPTVAIVSFEYPPSRGSSWATSADGPCQGYSVSATRAVYPLSGGAISLDGTRDAEEVEIFYSTSSNPTAQSDFSSLVGNITTVASGSSDMCLTAPDLSNYGVSEGDNVTMQLVYSRRGVMYYECADLTILSDSSYTTTNTVAYTCTNSTTTDTYTGYISSATATSAAAAAASTSASSSTDDASALTVTEAGVVGAMVTLAVGLLLAVGAWWAGFVAFGRKRKASTPLLATHNHMSETKSIASSA